jgi:hypothetical protein
VARDTVRAFVYMVTDIKLYKNKEYHDAFVCSHLLKAAAPYAWLGLACLPLVP